MIIFQFQQNKRYPNIREVTTSLVGWILLFIWTWLVVNKLKRGLLIPIWQAGEVGIICSGGGREREREGAMALLPF